MKAKTFLPALAGFLLGLTFLSTTGGEPAWKLLEEDSRLTRDSRQFGRIKRRLR